MAALLLALVATVVAGYLLLTRNRADDNRQAALAAARLYAVDLTTYDFATVDADFQRFARHGTTAFRVSYADGRASVLLAVDQEIRSAARSGPTVDRSRIRMSPYGPGTAGS